jgi:hypothetical protein
MMTALIILAGAALIFLIVFDVFSALINIFRERKKWHSEADRTPKPRRKIGTVTDTGTVINRFNKPRR